MIVFLIAMAFSKHFNLVELDLEKHATKTKLLSLELEQAVTQPEEFFPAHIDFLSEKIHLEVMLIDKKVSKF